MQINKLLTPYNHTAGTVDRIKYIVIHYVGALGGAEANCKYYAGADRVASAHYYVNFDGSVWQSVEDKNIAWHCGAKSYKHPECRNNNSIGIEMCVRNKGSQSDTSRDWYFEDATVQAAIVVPTTYTLGWNHDANGWWYANSKTSYLKSCWQIIDGHKYYFNPDGYALTGWQEIEGKWFYFEPRAGHDLECALYVSDRDGAQHIGKF
jgi:hypothetical protein